nr:ferrochelatase-2, chloroplastic-like [Tanacetum cinerariifolium]
MSKSMLTTKASPKSQLYLDDLKIGVTTYSKLRKKFSSTIDDLGDVVIDIDNDFWMPRLFDFYEEESDQQIHDAQLCHRCQITCRSSWNCNKIGSAITNLQLRTPIQSRSLTGKTLCSVGVWTYPISGTESHAHVMEEKVGVLLLNLGGPETLNDVQLFLYNLFLDLDIIHLPRLFLFLQRHLAKLISTFRAPKSKEGYASIAGGSPILRITDEQAHASKMALEAKEVPNNVYVAMRYCYSFSEESVYCLDCHILLRKKLEELYLITVQYALEDDEEPGENIEEDV